MARTFSFTPSNGLESVSGSPTNKGPGEVAIISGNTTQLAAIPDFKAAPDPAPSPAPTAGLKI